MAIQRQQGRRRFHHIQGDDDIWNQFLRFCSKRLGRILLILVFLALTPPIFFHFRLRRFQQMRLRKCSWINNPPLVCAHGGDPTNAFPNTLSAYRDALHAQVDCIEIDVSRSSDGVLFALHDRDLQRISGNSSARVGYLSMKEIKEIVTSLVFPEFHDLEVPTMEDALMLVSKSVRQVILDAKVGPPSHEKGLATDIISVVSYEIRGGSVIPTYMGIEVERTECTNCLVWAKSDTLARDVIKLMPDIPVGYIVLKDPSTSARTNLLRMKGAQVVGIYHPLIDEDLVKILHGRNKKVYAWTVDDADSMQKMLFERIDAIVTSHPTVLQRLMHEIRAQCLEEGFSLL